MYGYVPLDGVSFSAFCSQAGYHFRSFCSCKGMQFRKFAPIHDCNGNFSLAGYVFWPFCSQTGVYFPRKVAPRQSKNYSFPKEHHLYASRSSTPGTHKRTGRKNLGEGCPTQNLLFTNIFAQLRVKFCPNWLNLKNIGVGNWATCHLPSPSPCYTARTLVGTVGLLIISYVFL